jgi:hypothetical protein
MSTRIEDLPGPIPEEVIDNLQNIQNNIRQQEQEQLQKQLQQEELLRKNTIQNSQHVIQSPDIYKQSQLNTNVHMNIKKRVKFEDEDEKEEDSPDLFSFIKTQVSEENLLLLIILVLSSRSDLDNYFQYIPFIGGQLGGSEILSVVVRCFILLVLYLLTRQYILPKIKL